MIARILAVLFLVLMPIKARAADGYHLTNTISLPDAGGWDYATVDSAARRVYVSHGTEVDVLDADSEKVVGTIPGLQGVHGIAIAADLGRGFISDGRANAVVIFDLKTLQKLGTVETGKNPDAITYDPATKKIFTFNGGTGNATALDAVMGKVTGTIDLGGKPEFAATDGSGLLFDNLEDKSTVLEIDARQQKIVQQWPLAPGEEPSSLAIDRKNHRLFVGCHNNMLVVINYDTGKIVATAPIGEGVDATVFDPQTSLVITSNGEGTITVIHQDAPDKYHIVETVKTQKKSRTLALDEKTHRLFIPAAAFGIAPAPTAEQPHPRPPLVPGSFSVLVFDNSK